MEVANRWQVMDFIACLPIVCHGLRRESNVGTGHEVRKLRQRHVVDDISLPTLQFYNRLIAIVRLSSA